MKLNTPEIAWHEKKPILGIDFSKVGSKCRLASAGADNDVKIWLITCNEDQQTKIEFLANLNRHTKAVNVVRFSPKDEILASGGDDATIILWKLNNNSDHTANATLLEDDDLQNKESWTFHKSLRGHLEDVYDICWSPDGNNLISGSVDNSAIIWDSTKGSKLMILKDHKHYVQGVSWDPLGHYLVTNSSDRSCRLYNSSSYRCCYNISKLLLNGMQKSTENMESLKQGKMFHDETMPSFFRRPSYSPDGSLLIVPAGRIEVGDQVVNATYVFTRASPNKPVLYLPSPQKASVAVRCCPTLFELRQENGVKGDENTVKSLFKLPYRMVFAVATLDSVLLYDTQQVAPFAFIGNIHYAALTDATWSHDGSMLVVSSSDGYCSIIHFKGGELGKPYHLTVAQVLEGSSSKVGQNIDDPGKRTIGPVTEKPGNDEKSTDKTTMSNGKKEPVAGKISMFTVPMKITPTKPAVKSARKRIPLTPVQEQQAGTSPLTSSPNQAHSTSAARNSSSGAVTVNKITPRRIPLVPVGDKQAATLSSDVKVTDRNVRATDQSTMPVESHTKGKAPMEIADCSSQQQPTLKETCATTVPSPQQQLVDLTTAEAERSKATQSPCAIPVKSSASNQRVKVSQAQRRPVAFTTLISQEGDNARIHDLHEDAKTLPIQIAPRRPIPLEPKVIVLDD
ncbi:chromatin assembly factor 1 subunit B-like [Acropora palmata]|uniref:chromatin assembly factor 1 subunit B-like n=1 Tax=Acropora palmata TaxID=6131 RepID=UPI003DA0238C